MVALYRSHLLYAIQVSLPGFGGTTAALWALVSLSVQGEAGGGKRSKGQGGRRMKKLGGGWERVPRLPPLPPSPLLRVRWMKTCSEF